MRLANGEMEVGIVGRLLSDWGLREGREGLGHLRVWWSTMTI